MSQEAYDKIIMIITISPSEFLMLPAEYHHLAMRAHLLRSLPDVGTQHV